MPLLVDGLKVRKFEHLDYICRQKSSQSLEARNSELKNAQLSILGHTDFSLYVHQNEYAAVKPGTDSIKVVGTDEATTCHILIFRHTGSGVVSLAHLDGKLTIALILEMLKSLEKLSIGAPEGRLEMHLVGGFLDDRNLSKKLTKEIIDCMLLVDQAIHLTTYCTTDANDVVRNGIHYPILTGIGVQVNTGRLFPVEFTSKGPDGDLRSAGNSLGVGNKLVTSIYRDNKLWVGPYFWCLTGLECWPIEESDDYLRRNFSTSPEQESKYFANHMRGAFKILKDYPDPLALFKNGHPRVYELNGSTGTWERLSISDA